MDFVYKIRFTEERTPRVEENTEEENYGYVVFEGTVKKGAGEKGRRYSVRPPISTAAAGQIFKDDVNSFSSSVICYMKYPLPPPPSNHLW
jgi:hypothetical protein